MNDPASKKTRQVDVAAFGVDHEGRDTILAIGEVKWHETMSIAHLERLRHIRGLLTAQGRHGAATARLLCFSGAGFTAEIRDEAARSGEVRLLTPADLYTGILLQAPVGLSPARLRPARMGWPVTRASVRGCHLTAHCRCVPARTLTGLATRGPRSCLLQSLGSATEARQGPRSGPRRGARCPRPCPAQSCR